MKKICAFVLSLLMISSLTACCRIVMDGEDSAAQVKASGAMGISVSTPNNPFFVTLVEGTKEKTEELEVNLTVVDARGDPSKQTSDIEALFSPKISARIANPVDSGAVIGGVFAAITQGVKVISMDQAVFAAKDEMALDAVEAMSGAGKEGHA